MPATALTSFLGAIVGSRSFIKFFSCGCLGRRESRSWTYMWIVQLALHFGADLVAAQLVIDNKGYDHSRMPAVWDLALFYASRPRLAWVVLGSLGSLSEGWSSTAKQTMITETIMQLVGCYYLGRTADFAAEHQLYSHIHYNHGAQLMCGGALFTLIMTAGSILGLLVMLNVFTSDEKGSASTLSKICSVLISTFFGLLTFMGRLLFLIGYVKVAKDLYCPPSLLKQAIIWISMNVAGIALGTAAI